MSDALPKRKSASKGRKSAKLGKKASVNPSPSGSSGEGTRGELNRSGGSDTRLHVESSLGDNRSPERDDREANGDGDGVNQALHAESPGSLGDQPDSGTVGESAPELHIHTDEREQLAAFEGLRHPVAFLEILFGSKLDPWQQRVAVDYAKGGRVAALCANGVGKTKLISGLVLWSLSVLPQVKVVCTAGVFRQCQVMADYIHGVKHKFDRDWVFKEQEIISHDRCKAIWYSADHPGLFEGHHAENLCLFIDECKSVDAGIFLAAERLYATRTLYASSPGAATGHFYDCFTKWRDKYKCHHVRAFDSRFVPMELVKEREEMYGKDSDIYKSSVLAEFIANLEGSFIQLEWINRILRNPPRYEPGAIVAGIDLATSLEGDESVIVLRKGNWIYKIEAWRDDDHLRIASKCSRLLSEWGVPRENVFADAGGTGSGIVNDLKHMGWPVNGVQFGGKPIVKSERVQNRMTEMWDNMRTELLHQRLILPDDPKLITQLTSRMIMPTTAGRLKLESKGEMRKRGAESPDRADALALALMSPHAAFAAQKLIYSDKDYSMSDENPFSTSADGKFDYGN